MALFLLKIWPTRTEMLSAGPTPREAEDVGAHFAYLQDLTQRDVVLLAGRTLETDATSFGIVVFRAESREQAEEIVRNDPAVKGGVFQSELHAYRIALVNRLIADPSLAP